MKAGSAPCRQIRFTSDLSNRLCCPLAATAAACQCGLPVASTEAGPKLPHVHPAAPCQKSVPFEAATRRWKALGKGAWVPVFQSPRRQHSTGRSHTALDQLPQLGGLVPAGQEEPFPSRPSPLHVPAISLGNSTGPVPQSFSRLLCTSTLLSSFFTSSLNSVTQ